MPIDYINETDTNEKSQTGLLTQFYLIRYLQEDIQLTQLVSPGDEWIYLSTGHGFTAAAGEMIQICYAGFFIQHTLLAAEANRVKIDIPASTFLLPGAKVIRGSRRLNVNGSVTPVKFIFKLECSSSYPIDVYNGLISMQHAAEADDGKFGGIAQLANGVYFKVVDSGLSANLGVMKNNSEFRNIGGEVTYSNKAPAGTYGTIVEFDIKKTFGKILRFDPRIGMTIEATVRDDLTGLNNFVVGFTGAYNFVE